MKRRTLLARLAILLGLLLALLMLRHFDRDPIRIGGLPSAKDEPRARGVPPPRSGRGDVLLHLDRRRIDEAAREASFARADFSCGWIGLLESEFGAYSVVDHGDGDDKAAAPAARAQIVSSSALESVAPESLRAFLESGGSVLVDAPDGGRRWPPGWLELAGIGLAESDRPELLTDVAPSEIFAPGANTKEDRHQAGEKLGGLKPGVPRARPLDSQTHPLSDAEAPVYFERFFESGAKRGRLVIALLPIGRTFTVMTQGAPSDDRFGLKEKFGDYEGIVEPDDLVSSRDLRENELPYADMLAHSMAALLDPDPRAAPPLPRLLWFPQRSTGVVLATHDEDLRGGAKMLRLSEWDRDLGLKGTSFVIPHPRLAEDWLEPRDFVAAIAGAGGAIGMHWNQFPTPRGVGPIEPVEWIAPCPEQERWLRDLLPGAKGFRTNRNHYLVLRDDWTEAYRILAARGVRLDSTLASNKGRGYLLGSARPHPLLDDRGYPLDLRELPFINQEDWGGADAAFFTRMFEANALRFGGALVTLFHPHLVVNDEAGAKLFVHVAKEALRTGHRPLTMEEMLDFWDARLAAEVHAEVRGPRTLAIRARAGRDDLQLGLPLIDATRVVVDGKDLPRRRIGAREFALLALPAGDAEIVAEWK